jgi:hypothetical protein
MEQDGERKVSKTGSYIKLDRGLKSNSLWLEKPFSKGQAWVDLLLLAQGVEKEKQYRGKIQKQKSGEIYTSIIYLTNRWGWSRNKVYRFLKELIKQKMVTVKGWEQTEHSNGTNDGTLNETNNGTTNGTIVTIENWALYQNVETKDDTNNGTQDGTKKRTRNGTHNRKQYTRESNTEKAEKRPPKSPTGGQTPSGEIPEIYRGQFKSYDEYIAWRNQ